MSAHIRNLNMTDEKTHSEKQREPISISEAARLLRKSERTIYRMIKSGKLQSAKMSDTRMTNVIFESDFKCQISDFMSDKNAEMSDIKEDRKWAMVEHELREKDEQIRKLIDHQKEMLSTIHQLQSQVHELSRWILDHTSEKNTRVPDTSSSELAQRPTGGMLRHWIKMRRK